MQQIAHKFVDYFLYMAGLLDGDFDDRFGRADIGERSRRLLMMKRHKAGAPKRFSIAKVSRL